MSEEEREISSMKTDLIFPYTKKRKTQFWAPKAPRAFEISTRNHREVVGLGQTRVQPSSEFGERDQGQVGGQHLSVWRRGAQVFRDIDPKPSQGGQP